MPSVLACGVTHVSPGQQSALVVQPPHLGTQASLKHTNGEPPSTSAGFGTHGTSLQQSALDAHDEPAGTHVTPVHRGTPRLSCLHVSLFSQLPLQQSHEALHDEVDSLHTSPFGLHPVGLPQTPTTLGGVMVHVTGPPLGMTGMPTEPQQSVSLAQRSPTT
jgi:hypothetical protein